MTWTARALSLFLTVWMTAVTGFPLCCWSMTVAHEHQGQQEPAAGAVRSHGHHHHDTGVASAPAPTASAVPVQDCATESAEMIATLRVSASSMDMHAVMAGPAGFTLRVAQRQYAGASDLAPPGARLQSAFLKPLRV